MINTINKYLDYSFDNIMKIFNSNKYNSNKEYHLKLNITLSEILVLVVRLGSKGFYIDNEFTNILDKLNNMILEEKLEYKISIIHTQVVTFFVIIDIDQNLYSHNICQLDCWDFY